MILRSSPISIFTLIVVLGLFSCKKGEITYDFEGKITETVNGTSLEGAEIEIRQILFNSSVANYNYQLAGSGVSDGLGEWSVSFNREKVTEMQIEIQKEGYFDQLYEFSSADVSVEDVNTYNTNMDAESWVKFDLKNVGPSPGDKMTMALINFREGCNGCGENIYYSFGEVVDTIIVFKTTAGKYNRFQFNDETTASLVDDSLLTVPSDTVSYTFHY